MHFNGLSAALILALSTFAAAAPAFSKERDLVLERRSIRINWSFDPKGDLNPPIAPPPLPTSPPPSNSQTSKFNQKMRQFTAKSAVNAAAVAQVEPRVQDVINAASSSLGFPSSMTVTLKNNFHTSKDPEKHATFSFSTPTGPCSSGCIGHAYNPVSTNTPGKGQPGKIFDSTHKAIFGGQDFK